MKNKIFLTISGILVIGVGFFFYQTRPLSAPTANVEDVVSRLNENGKLLNIDSSKSQAEFSLNEVLRGVPTLVVGTTSQLAGDIVIESENPFKIKIGEIKINAKTFKTDNTQRNGALGRMILKSEDPANEFIVFTPKEILELPEQIEKNKEFSFKINGDLLIKGVTKPVVFNAKATQNDDDSWTAVADTNVAYADFGISVPNLPFLANVDKVVNLKISLSLR